MSAYAETRRRLLRGKRMKVVDVPRSRLVVDALVADRTTFDSLALRGDRVLMACHNRVRTRDWILDVPTVNVSNTLFLFIDGHVSVIPIEMKNGHIVVDTEYGEILIQDCGGSINVTDPFSYVDYNYLYVYNDYR